MQKLIENKMRAIVLHDDTQTPVCAVLQKKSSFIPFPGTGFLVSESCKGSQNNTQA